MYRFFSFALALCLAGFTPALFAQRSSTLDWTNMFLGDKQGAAQAMAVDRDGSIWIAGSSTAQFDAFAPNVAFQLTPGGRSDIFVARLVRQDDGRYGVRFFTWLGGSGDEEVRAMTVDSIGRVYLTGITTSPDFPTGGYYHQGSNAGQVDTFLTVIDPRFSGIDSVVHSSYYGGALDDYATAIAVDSSFNVYVTGYTTSEGLPGTTGKVQEGGRGGWDSFLIKVNPANSSPLVYATYFGGKGTDIATGVAIDARGNVWFSGYTSSDDFPVTAGAYREKQASYFDGFLVGLDTSKPGLSAHIYGSYLGGNGADYPKGLAIDASGRFWMTGYTFSTNFPLSANAYQRTLGGNADLFLLGLDITKPADQVVSYGTYLGGQSTDIPYDLRLLSNGRVALAGYTTSGNLPLAGGPVQTKPTGDSVEGFVAILNTAAADASGLEYSTYIGGSASDLVTSVIVDASNAIFVAGSTTSTTFPGTPDREPAQGSLPFLLRISR